MRREVIVHFSSIIAALIGAIYQLILINLMQLEEYGFINAALAISYVFSVFCSSSLTNFLFQFTNLKESKNYYLVFISHLFLAVLLSNFLYLIIFKEIVVCYIIILNTNVIISVLIEYSIAINITKYNQPFRIAIIQLNNVLPRIFLLLMCLILGFSISNKLISYIYVLTFIYNIIFCYKEIKVPKRFKLKELFSKNNFNDLVNSSKYGYSNLLETGINQSPTLLSANLIGGEFSALVSFCLYFLNLAYNIPFNIYKRFRLMDFHKKVLNIKKIMKIYSSKELVALFISGCLILIAGLCSLKIDFVTKLIDNYIPDLSASLLILLFSIPFRYTSLYLGALLNNKKHLYFKIKSQLFTLLISLILYILVLCFFDLKYFFVSVVFSEIVLFTYLIYSVFSISQNENKHEKRT